MEEKNSQKLSEYILVSKKLIAKKKMELIKFKPYIIREVFVSLIKKIRKINVPLKNIANVCVI